MFTPGDKVHGYEVVGSVSGGKSQSWQVRKGPQLYFLKMLPRPKYPQPDKPTPDRYRRMLTVCADFEQRNREIMHSLSSSIVGGGNLVKPNDFFRAGNCYVKSYPFISAESCRAIASPSVSRDHRVIFLKTLMLCVRELHAHGIVHGDLKPENVLIERRDAGPVARLIDFDEAYMTGRPPPPSQAPGSEDYYSPELLRYRNNDVAPTELTVGADLFALGLVIHVALLGGLPAVHGGTGETPAEIVAHGGSLRYESLGLGMPDFEATLSATSAPTAASRPTIDELLTSAGVKLAPLPPSPPPPPAAKSASRIISTVGKRRSQPENSGVKERAG